MFRRTRREAAVLEPPPVLPSDRRERSELAAIEDAVAVLAGERVVRAILAHHGVLMFPRVCPDIDLETYLAAYREVPGSMAPFDRRRSMPTPAYDGPLRRVTDFQ